MPDEMYGADPTRPSSPQSSENLGDAASFVSDAGMPDYTPTAAGASFVKTWRLRNTGRTGWDAPYRLRFVHGEQMGGPPEVELAGAVPPGRDAEVSVEFTAPTSEGAHAGYWQMQNGRGELFGDRLRVVIVVIGGAVEGPAAAAPAPETVAHLSPPPAALAPKAAGSPNLLRNAAFEQGDYERLGLRIPNQWEAWCADETTPPLPGQGQPFATPQGRILSLAEAGEWERDVFLHGDYCWKVWAEWRPVWVALRQKLSGLSSDERYRLTVSIQPDLVMNERGSGKEYADDPAAGEHRLSASFGGHTLATLWMDGREVPFGATTQLAFEFSPTASIATVAVEFRARWGLQHTGWYISGATLEELPDGADPAPPASGPSRHPPPLHRPRLAPKSRPMIARQRAKSPPVPPFVRLTPIPIRNRLFDLSLDGWETWANVAPGDRAYQMPKFEAYASPVITTRVLAGRTALRISSEAGTTYEAGVRQTVTGLQPGTPLRFTANGQIWASSGDNPYLSEGAGKANLRIGIDPRGGQDPGASSIVWSPYHDPWDEYKPFQVEAVALADSVTLLLYSRPSLCLKHNETFWDDTSLAATGPAVLVVEPSPAGEPASEAVGEPAPEPPPAAAVPQPSVSPPPTAQLNPRGPNLLRNASFEDGVYNAAPELGVPDQWEIWCAGESTPRLERQAAPFGKPETRVWRKRDAGPTGRRRYFGDGRSCWRAFGELEPIWIRLQQRVAGLRPGETYRFRAPIFPEPATKFRKIAREYASDPLASEQRLVVESGGESADTGWRDGSTVPFGQYTALSLDFTASAAEAVVAIEMRGRWGLERNQWIVDECEFRELG